MKRIATLILALLIGIAAYAQEPVKEKDVLGEWKLVIDIDEDEIIEEIEEDEDIPFFGEWIAESVVGLVFNIIDDLDIYMTFKDRGRLRVEVEIFGEREIEYTEWFINNKGELVIGEIGVFDSDDDVWMMDRGRLVSYESGRRGRFRDQDVYLEKID